MASQPPSSPARKSSNPSAADAAFVAALVESSDDAIVGEDTGGVIVVWNRGAEVLYGYTAAEAVGRPAFMLIPLDRQHESEGVSTRARAGEHVRGLETVRIRKDGRLVAVSLTASPIGRDGAVVGVATIARSINERQRADEKVRAAAQYAHSLIEASLDPLVTISPEGKITDVNEATVKVTGVTRESLIGTDFFDYFVESEKARKGYQQVFSMGSVKDYPLTIRHRNGKLVNVLYNASVYRDTMGNVLGVFAAVRDVTAQKQAEAEVAEQRARELERLGELERFQKLTVGRELKMIELKKEIEALRRMAPERGESGS